MEQHSRRFYVGGMTVRVESDIPIEEKTFDPKIERFRASGDGEDTVVLIHHFSIPSDMDLGREIYRKPPWAIFRKDDSWIYAGILPEGGAFYRLAVFNADHTRGEFYNGVVLEEMFRRGGLKSLSLFPTDQVVLARVLAYRGAVIIHSTGLVINGGGYLFAGHSGAGKSTITRIIGDKGEVLCDDRIIVRLEPEGFRIYGTWSHGEIADVSSADAPLKGIYFLRQDEENKVVPITNRAEVAKRLLALIIKPLVTADWWHKVFDVVEVFVSKAPAYELRFDKSGRIADLIP